MTKLEAEVVHLLFGSRAKADVANSWTASSELEGRRCRIE